MIAFPDRPDPPGKPEVVDSNKDHISIKWDPPKKDGGAPITGYNIERRDPKTGRWSKLNSEPVPVSDDLIDSVWQFFVSSAIFMSYRFTVK